MGFLIDCSEAKRCCDKAQYKEAGFVEKLKLRFHILYCKTCKKYSRVNQKLSVLLKKASIKTCSKEEKRKFREKIERNM